MRVNPRTVLLAALQEGPRTRSDLWREVFEHVMANGRQESCQQTDAVLARHLCHLTRSKQVVRLPDGRYAIRGGPFIWPGTRSLGTIAVTVGEGEIRKGALVGIDPAGLAREYLETPCRAPVSFCWPDSPDLSVLTIKVVE